ncbi:MAG: methionine biosynthesis protein MetW [Candidatus Omnitrophota bacterium]
MDRLEHKIISQIVEPGSHVLDLGCGTGELMQLLKEKNHAKAQGIELDEKKIYSCVEKGLNVFHGNIDGGLIEYPDKTFDYVILNQSMQEVKNAGVVIKDALRIGKKVIVGFPNFAYIPARLRLFFKGKTPITASLPYRWYDTPNLHFLTISDFKDFCAEKSIDILSEHYINRKKRIRFSPNLFATDAIFVIKSKN